MELTNETTIQEFILLVFQMDQQKQFLLFIFFCILYVLSLAKNITIIVLLNPGVHTSQHSMYILLNNFSWTEMCNVSDAIPCMLFDLESPAGVISFYTYLLQFYSLFFFGNVEFFFLLAIALHHGLAIWLSDLTPTIVSKYYVFKFLLCSSGWLLESWFPGIYTASDHDLQIIFL